MNTPSVVECVTRRSKHWFASAFGLLKPSLKPQLKMKKNNTRQNRSLLTTTITSLALLLLTGRSALAANWTITDLGALGAEHSGVFTSKGCNINNAGQVAGQGVVLINGTREMHYVVWSNGTQIDLGIRGELEVAPINDAGQVAGVIAAEDYRPFLWQTGVVTRLPMLPNTVNGCRVAGINASGAVVGDNGVQRWWGVERVSVRWQGGTVSPMNLDWAWGQVAGINDSGDLAIGNSYMRHRSYVLSGGFTNEVDWPGMDPVNGTTKALDINNAGQVCGWYIADPSVDGSPRALLWQVGVGGTFLPNFPINSHSEAVALNLHGHAVGWAYRAGNDAPGVLWRDGTIMALDRLPEVVAAGWSGLTARDINDHGQIVGYGSHGGLVTAFLLSPVTAPPPSLTITRAATNTIAISWPAPAEGWVLEGTNALPSVPVASWPLVLLPYQTNGDSISVTFMNTPPVGHQFFRLHKP
jgi:hypothetical protein